VAASSFRTTRERGSRCSGAAGETRGERREAVLPGDTVDTSSESARKEAWLVTAHPDYPPSSSDPHQCECVRVGTVGPVRSSCSIDMESR
jgi:hypothetical protein